MQCGEDSDVEVALILRSFTQCTVRNIISSPSKVWFAFRLCADFQELTPEQEKLLQHGLPGPPSAVLKFWNLSWQNSRLKMSSLCRLELKALNVPVRPRTDREASARLVSSAALRVAGTTCCECHGSRPHDLPISVRGLGMATKQGPADPHFVQPSNM